MVIFAAAALGAAVLSVAPAPASAPAAPERQALAMVRILPAEPVRFSKLETTRPEVFRDSRIRDPDGSIQPARLVEFQ